MNEIYLLNTNRITETDLPLSFKDYKTNLKNTEKRISSFVAYEFVKYIAYKDFGAKSEDIKFKTTSNGKPYIENANGFNFSISHSGNLVAVAISFEEIGIDIEKVRKVNLQLCDRFFTKNEKAYITAYHDFENERFFEIWTKKEAYIKFQGSSISKLTAIDVLQEQLNENFYTFKSKDFCLSIYSKNNTKPTIKNLAFAEIISVINSNIIVENQSYL